MSSFTITDTPIAGLKIIERQQLGDSRRCFSRLFCVEELAAAGWKKPIVQINHSLTQKQGTIRGMHFQRPPHLEMKIVNCNRGEVWDVAVDVRTNSATFLSWYAERLSAVNGRALLIPEGFAHGFQALTDDAELMFFHSAPYAAEAEAGLIPQTHVWPSHDR
jgi:dTDP-4-dehydrorhamnose 3,5-epimerase